MRETCKSLSTANILQKAGACLCASIGVWRILVVAHLTSLASSLEDIVVLIPFTSYGVFAFVPFVAFIYPRLRAPRKSVTVSVSIAEILIIGIFLWAILFLHAAA
jgi:hypothetical protein